MTAVVANIEEARLVDADESALARRLACGDHEALDAIVALYRTRVTRLAHRLLGWAGDPEDVVQDVFVTTLRTANRFRGHSSLWTWLATITVNRCRRHLRRKTLWRRFLSSPPRHAPADAAAADQGALETETARRVREAVAVLPAPDREVIVLYYLEECSMLEMSQLIGATENALRVRLHRARTKLAVTLADFVQD